MEPSSLSKSSLVFASCLIKSASQSSPQCSSFSTTSPPSSPSLYPSMFTLLTRLLLAPPPLSQVRHKDLTFSSSPSPVQQFAKVPSSSLQLHQQVKVQTLMISREGNKFNLWVPFTLIECFCSSISNHQPQFFSPSQHKGRMRILGCVKRFQRVRLHWLALDWLACCHVAHRCRCTEVKHVRTCPKTVRTGFVAILVVTLCCYCRDQWFVIFRRS